MTETKNLPTIWVFDSSGKLQKIEPHTVTDKGLTHSEFIRKLTCKVKFQLRYRCPPDENNRST